MANVPSDASNEALQTRFNHEIALELKEAKDNILALESALAKVMEGMREVDKHPTYADFVVWAKSFF